ncbi:hypothetical protein ATANTOWER_025725, partial [Ataeniobius toweri]|nr:hypothetical protein [Ataeniobius toweri]
SLNLSLKLRSGQNGCILETSRPELHPLLGHLRQRCAGCAEAAVQNRGTEGCRSQRQSQQAQNSMM